MIHPNGLGRWGRAVVLALAWSAVLAGCGSSGEDEVAGRAGDAAVADRSAIGDSAASADGAIEAQRDRGFAPDDAGDSGEIDEGQGADVEASTDAAVVIEAAPDLDVDRREIQPGDARTDASADAARDATVGSPDAARDATGSDADAGCPSDYQKCATGCCKNFVVERVDPPVGGGGGTALALAFDAQGIAHAAYVDPSTAEVIYAVRAGAAFRLERVASEAQTNDQSVGLALDSVGAPHVVYLDRQDGSLRHAHRSGNTWTSELVDADAGPNAVSIAIDHQDTVHVAYFGGDRLGHASKAAQGGWLLETVDGVSTGVGSYASLALDSIGRPRISYWDYTNGDLKYAAWNGSVWQIEAVDTAGNVGNATSLALDATDKPRIAYQDATTFYFKYAEWTGSAWVISSPPLNHDATPHLVLDGAGNPWVSDYGYDFERPRLMHRVGSTWVKETFASDDPGGAPTAVAREPSGNVALLYLLRSPSNTVRLAHLVGGVWTNDVVDQYADAGRQSELSLDTAGLPHISYLNQTSGQVWYATRDPLGAWTRQLVRAVDSDNSLGGGGHTSIAVDSTKHPHVAYYNSLSKQLEIAVRSGTSWAFEIVDTPSFGATWTSLVLDGAGQARIAYLDGTDALLYASRMVGGGYMIETVAASALEPSLVLDGSGNPHLSYFDRAAHAIVYARRSATAWTKENVEAADDTFHANGLRVDSLGAPHLCFEQVPKGGLGSLRYATRPPAGVWTVVSPVLPNANSGQYCSITLDAKGLPHIAHSTDFYFYESHLENGVWVTVRIDFGSGGFSSIALDPTGATRVSYFDYESHELKYAWEP